MGWHDTWEHFAALHKPTQYNASQTMNDWSRTYCSDLIIYGWVPLLVPAPNNCEQSRIYVKGTGINSQTRSLLRVAVFLWLWALAMHQSTPLPNHSEMPLGSVTFWKTNSILKCNNMELSASARLFFHLCYESQRLHGFNGFCLFCLWNNIDLHEQNNTQISSDRKNVCLFQMWIKVR